MSTVPGRPRSIDELMFLLVERQDDATPWGGTHAIANAVGDDGSRGDLQPDLATRYAWRPRASRRLSRSTANVPSFRAARPFHREWGRSW